MNQSSIRPSKLLPIRDLVIDLSEDWQWHNCIIARIVLTKAVKFNKIVIMPQFLTDFIAKELQNGTIR